MNKCIFCRIISGELKSKTIYQDNLVQVIMDIDPISEGHMLVIPKAHKLDLDELTEEEAIRITQISKILVKVLKEKYNCDGYSIMQNGGAFNDVGHYHMHVFQRNKGDGFEWHFKDVEYSNIDIVGESLRDQIVLELKDG